MSEPQAPWVPSALLQGRASTPRFLRAPWDAGEATAFGPWRVTPAADPALPPPEGLEEAAEALPEPLAVAVEDVAAPVEPGISEDELRQAVEAAEARALEQGRAEGREQALAEVAAEREALRHLAIELRALHEDGQRLHEPVRRLALHIAEQLVRGELSASAEAISQVVRQALAALDEDNDKVVASLHPADVELLQAQGPDFLAGVKLQPDPQLHRGSVRLRMDDTVLEDLVEHRLQALAERLLAQPARFMQASALLHEPPAAPPDGLARRARVGEVVDATVVPQADPGLDDAEGQGE